MLDKFDYIEIDFNGRMYGHYLEFNSLCINFTVRFNAWLEAAAKLAMARWEHAPAEEIKKLERMAARKKFFLNHLDVDILAYLDREIPAE